MPADDLYAKVISDSKREKPTDNLVTHVRGADKRIQIRQTALFYKVVNDYGEQVAEGLELSTNEVKRLASMSQEEITPLTLA